jgi:hypothetical protein
MMQEYLPTFVYSMLTFSVVGLVIIGWAGYLLLFKKD